MTEHESVREHVANAAQVAQAVERYLRAAPMNAAEARHVISNAIADVSAVNARLTRALAQLDGRTTP